MKLLHVAASYLPATRYGGTIASVHGLCKALAARGHDVHVFTTSVDGPRDSPVVHGAPTDLDGVTVHYFQSRALRRLFYAPDLGRALDARVADFDVVHTHAIYLWPLWCAARAARAARVPHVVSPRGMLEKGLVERKSAVWKALLIAFIERRQLESAAAVHVTSRREREEAAAFGFNFPRFFEVPNGVDAAVPEGVPSAAVAALQSERFVLFLGRINWKKGLDRAVAAMSLAPDVKLVVAGPDERGYQQVVEELAMARDVASRLVFTGPANAADKAALFRMARALVLPSYSENFGNVVIEAWAEGCPVIVTPEVGLADAVEESGGGWVVNGTTKELAAAMERVASNPALRLEAGERGRAAAQRHFTWPAVAAQMETIYEYSQGERTTAVIPAVAILTFNESANIARTLSGVAWAREIVVVDSGSTDDTRDIAAGHPGVRVVQRPFTSHAEQWNFAVHETGIASEWVLALDADYFVTADLAAEIRSIEPAPGVDGYWASFAYCIDGLPLRGAAYPPVAVLFRRAHARYEQDGHTQRVKVDGATGRLSHRILHDDRKPLAHWITAQSRYMRLEAQKLLETQTADLPWIDRLRLGLIIMPPAMFVYCYLVRGGILDGTRGLFYAMQRAAAEAILSLYLIERRIYGGR